MGNLNNNSHKNTDGTFEMNNRGIKNSKAGPIVRKNALFHKENEF